MSKPSRYEIESALSDLRNVSFQLGDVHRSNVTARVLHLTPDDDGYQELRKTQDECSNALLALFKRALGEPDNGKPA